MDSRRGFVKRPLFLFLGLFALSFPLAGSYLFYQNALSQVKLYFVGQRAKGIVESKRTDTSRRTVKGARKRNITVYLVTYRFETSDGKQSHGIDRKVDKTCYEGLEGGQEIEIVYDKDDPAFTEAFHTVKPSLGKYLFYGIGMVFVGLMYLPGLFFLYVSTKGAPSAGVPG